MKTKIVARKGFTLIELLVVMTIIAVLATVGFGAFNKARETARITTAIQNLKGNIYNAMIQYASDNNDRFPYRVTDLQGGQREAANSNEAFRELIRFQYLSDEAPFGVGLSPANPDGDIGEPPLFNRALERNENHWELAGPLLSSGRSSVPLVWENSLSGGWNPSWDSSLAGSPVRGRTWSGGRVIILDVSGKVESHTITNMDGPGQLRGPGSGATSRNVFQQTSSIGAQLRILTPLLD